MQCPACEVAFHEGEDTWEATDARSESTTFRCWQALLTLCPECEEPIVKLESRVAITDQLTKTRVVYPTSAMQVSVSDDVPEDMRMDYIEATRVLPISPKASAALSRRVLQSMMNEQGFTGANLAKQVDAILSETAAHRVLPLYVKDKIDVIRNFGNFSAHPITDLTTLQIIDVEPEEAEWCLEIVSDLFDHYYVRPASDKRKLARLNQKLASAGKPLAK